MVRPKASSKQKQKQKQRGGVDFKKIKRKLGRKLPPPKNATDTEIKSKAIILPEQSVAAEKLGLAVSKKGLTLKELLQQTSHHNLKVRRDAMAGIKDLFHKHPEELRSHKYIVMEKLRERISDTDKVVRESLYQLLKSVVFPTFKEDNQGPLIALIMSYIFNAMTNLAIDVQLMAFKFFDLVIQHHPPSFSLHAEKILENYENIFRTSQVCLQDKGKLRSALGGLVHCLSLLPSNKREVDSSEEDFAGHKVLHAFECDATTEPAGSPLIFNKLKNLVPILVNCFHIFVPLSHGMPKHDAQSFDCMLGLLESIDHSVRYFVHGTQKRQPEAQLSCGVDTTIFDQTISSVLLKKLLVLFPLNPSNNLSEKADDRYFILNILSTEIFLQLSERICPPAVQLGRFLEFIENALNGKVCSGTRSGKAVRDKHILSIIPFIPKLVSWVNDDWKFRLLQAFTDTFVGCHAESTLKLDCLSAVEQMLIPGKELDLASDPELLDYQITWIEVLPLLLNLFGDKHPSRSKVVLQLILRLGQCALLNPSIAWAYDNMQNSLCEFYSTSKGEGNISYGPFMRLPRYSQELSVCSLYYFSNLNSGLLSSVVCCCLCNDLEPLVLFRIIEVLHSAYKSAHIQIADHISFFITLLSRFRVSPDHIYPVTETEAKISNRELFKSVTTHVCSYLSEIGDESLVFQMVEKIVIDQISVKPPLDNVCAMLRMLVMLDSKPTKLSDQSIITLNNFISGYLIDVIRYFPEDNDESNLSLRIRTRRYYFLPCLFFFERSHKLLSLVLNTMESLITENGTLHSSRNESHYATDFPSRINATVSVLLLICKDAKIQRVIALFPDVIDRIAQSLNLSQSSKEINMTIEERHKVQCAYDRLEIARSIFPK